MDDADPLAPDELDQVVQVAMPPGLREGAADPDVRVSLRWRTGPERGGTFRVYRLS